MNQTDDINCIKTKPMTLKTVARAVNGRLNNSDYENRSIDGVVTDSRAAVQNKLFIPLKGARADAHAFIGDVFTKGAAASLAETAIRDDGYPVIYVDDTKKALLRLAAYYRGLFDVHVVGVTGSTGKTTTKDLIAAVLAQKYTVLKTEGNYNNEIGLPMTLFRLTDETAYAVIEMGTSGFGEIRALSEAAQPQTAVITNIGVAHIENLGSRAGVLKAKTEIFDFLAADGTAVLYGGDDMLAALKGSRERLLFYGGDGGDFYATDIRHNAVRSVTFTLHINKTGESAVVRVPAPGLHMVSNALCAAAVGTLAGLTVGEIQKGIEQFNPSALRMALFKGQSGANVLNDTYNANPASVRAALDVLSNADGEKLCVLGDMLELGDATDELHYEVGRYAARLNIDDILTFGEHSAYTHEGALSMIQSFNSTSSAVHFSDKEALTAYLLAAAGPDTTILLKASRGMRFEEIAQRLG